MRALKPNEVDVRVGSVGKKGVTMLLYKNARVDMQILDETYGAENWQRDHKEVKGNLYCGIGIWDEKKSQWVWKWDCGAESNTEKEKGEASDAFKRAGFNVGIGRELYTAPFIFLPIHTEQNGRGYKVSNPAELYGMYVSDMTIEEVDGVKRITSLDIAQKQREKTMIIWSTDKRKEGVLI